MTGQMRKDLLKEAVVSDRCGGAEGKWKHCCLCVNLVHHWLFIMYNVGGTLVVFSFHIKHNAVVKQKCNLHSTNNNNRLYLPLDTIREDALPVQVIDHMNNMVDQTFGLGMYCLLFTKQTKWTICSYTINKENLFFLELSCWKQDYCSANDFGQWPRQ